MTGPGTQGSPVRRRSRRTLRWTLVVVGLVLVALVVRMIVPVVRESMSVSAIERDNEELVSIANALYRGDPIPETSVDYLIISDDFEGFSTNSVIVVQWPPKDYGVWGLRVGLVCADFVARWIWLNDTHSWGELRSLLQTGKVD